MDLAGKIGTVVGIDPDIARNGVAAIRRGDRSLEVRCLTFPETLEWVKALHAECPGRFMVYVEAGWLNRGNWHVTGNPNGKFSPSAWAAAVGKSDGECSAVSKKLIECFEYYGIPVTPQKPFRKCWKGRDRKITHEELMRELSVYGVSHGLKRTNQETRDACLIALMNI